MLKEIRLFNTASRSKDAFQSIEPGKAGLYTCGPTVYHYAHIGNLRTYVFEDLLVRALGRAGYEVNHVMNITDVGHLTSDADTGDDKMEASARKSGRDIWELAEHYERVFFADLEKLNVLAPGLKPKATNHVAEMIELVQRLESKGFTYRTEDGIYFDTARFPAYADFGRLDVENLEAGKRVDMGGKRSATDFALWKFSPPGEKRQMEWDSPWGRGFPGWHIECSAMAMKYLGETFDIHCGGIDHVKVHHTNEIAQSEAATGKRFANTWMHGEFLIEDSGKMSKSKGDFLTLSLLEREGYHPMEYRFLLLQAHYRSTLKFSWDSLKAAAAGYRGIVERLRGWKDAAVSADPGVLAIGHGWVRDFEKAVFDDLNLPAAVSVLFGLLRDERLPAGNRRDIALDLDGILGLQLSQAMLASDDAVPAEVQALIMARDQARRDRNWGESDRLRGELQARGYAVEDSPQGTRVRR